MTDITAAKSNISEEETSYKASISEATMQKVGASINWLNANAGTQLGDMIPSFLTETQFQSLRGTEWVQMNGQSIAGSDLAVLTGITTLPNMVDGGTVIQSDSDGNLATTSSGDNKQHTHSFSANLLTTSSGNYVCSTNSTVLSNTITTTADGSTSNNLAAGVKGYWYVRINN